MTNTTKTTATEGARDANLSALNDRIEYLTTQLADREREVRELRAREMAGLGGIDIIGLATEAFVARNRKALQAQETGDIYDGADAETYEVKPQWYWVRPLQAIRDGFYKALHGSTYNGRTTKGAIASRETIVEIMMRSDGIAELVHAAGSDPATAAAALRLHPQFEALVMQETLIAMLQKVSGVFETAYDEVAAGEPYAPPAERAARYEANTRDRASTAQVMSSLVALAMQQAKG